MAPLRKKTAPHEWLGAFCDDEVAWLDAARLANPREYPTIVMSLRLARLKEGREGIATLHHKLSADKSNWLARATEADRGHRWLTATVLPFVRRSFRELRATYATAEDRIIVLRFERHLSALARSCRQRQYVRSLAAQIAWPLDVRYVRGLDGTNLDAFIGAWLVASPRLLQAVIRHTGNLIDVDGKWRRASIAHHIIAAVSKETPATIKSLLEDFRRRRTGQSPRRSRR